MKQKERKSLKWFLIIISMGIISALLILYPFRYQKWKKDMSLYAESWNRIAERNSVYKLSNQMDVEIVFRERMRNKFELLSDKQQLEAQIWFQLFMNDFERSFPDLTNHIEIIQDSYLFILE